MKLVPVHDVAGHASLLWWLLSERAPEASISHREMPTYEAHCEFVADHPYKAWYLVWVGDGVVGATYLGQENNIGIAILQIAQRRGHGPQAVRMLMAAHPSDDYYANINPANRRSIRMFQKLGFSFHHSEPAQIVYRFAA